MNDSPELSALRHRRDAIRIPDETDVPLTPRVRRLIDTSPFRRLASIPQLGLVSWVYPGATHSRFEHSLGVYRNALLFVDALRVDARFRDTLQGEELDRLIVAALLHDVGHWPFCHPIEDLSLAGVPHHEAFATQWLNSDEIRTALAEDWGLTPESIVRTLDGPYETSAERMAASVLSGPIDVDKLDYLVRDSLHAGVPYGRNFDRSRLIGGLCLDAAGARLALDEKAKTAAEMMVFARYVMFSEVYWHHAVRAATAMFQRAFYEAAMLRGQPTGEVDWSDWFRDDHAGFIRRLMQTLEGSRWLKLADGLFGARRRLWKRWAQYSAFDGGEVYARLARRPYPWTVSCADRLAAIVRRATGIELEAGDILIDAPPVGLEVEFRVEIREGARGRYRPLAEISPMIHTLATRQFDDFVKRVRIFVAPEWIETLRSRVGGEAPELLERWIEEASEG